MKLLINLGTLKKGGGQNVALNFLKGLEKINSEGFDFYFLAVKNSTLHNYLIESGYVNIWTTPVNPVERIFFELTHGRNLMYKNNIDIVYTYFGIGLFPKKTLQVIGSADSNLFFPEIDFWVEYKGIKRLKKYLVDKFRIWGLNRASAVIFENESMEARSHDLFKLSQTTFIKPSVSTDFNNKIHYVPKKIKSKTPIGLFLCGWQRNKNVMLIPEIANKFKEANQEFHFILTAPLDNSYDHKQFKQLVRKFNVSDMISVVGQIQKEELKSLYQQIDYVFLLSKLESFSNNIIEAWQHEKTLVVSNEIWAKSICKDAAIYVDRNSSVQISKKIMELEQKPIIKKIVIDNGKIVLKEYPSIMQKTQQELDYIKYVYKKS
jgi:glycosyltransferase involved in cell wall biosynthesis